MSRAMVALMLLLLVAGVRASGVGSYSDGSQCCGLADGLSI